MRTNLIRFASVLLATGILVSGVANADVSSCPSISRTLKYGMKGADVTTLQTYLSTDSSLYPEASVTGFFGRATEKAVQRFQVAHGIVTSGTPASTGYGAVGAKTRAALLACGSNTAKAATGASAATTSVPIIATSTPSATTSVVIVVPQIPSGPLVEFADGATTTTTYGVGPVPTIGVFSVAPKTINIPNDPVSLFWTSSNTSNCSVGKLTSSNLFGTLFENVGVNGSVNFNPTDDGSVYSLKCIGAGDNGTTTTPTVIQRDFMIHITNPKPTCSVSTDKTSYPYSLSTIKVTWTSQGADTVTWAHGGTVVDPVALPYGNQYPSGNIMLSSVAGNNQNITLNVSGPGGSTSCSASFSITSAANS